MLCKVTIVLLFAGVITSFELGHSNELEKREIRKNNMVCFQHPLDIAFILDASSSIWAQNFTKAKNFVSSFIEPYEIGPEKVRVAIETYAHRVYKEDAIHFDDFLTKDSLQAEIAKLVWHHGHRTETGLSLEFLRLHIYNEHRPEVPTIVIVITDGKSQEPEETARQAKIAHKAGIEIFAIGVSDAVDKQELENIAGDPDRVIIVKTYEELESIKDKLSGQTCKDIPTPPPTQAAEECGIDIPTDIYYVFDPAYLGIERVNWVTSFISSAHEEEEFTHMKVGVISGSCPLDAGFNLNKYTTFQEVQSRLAQYEHTTLNILIEQLTSAYIDTSGGRSGAKKVAVIFIGGKVDDQVSIIRSVEEAKKSGVAIFFADAGNADKDLLKALEEIGFNLSSPETGTSAKQQALNFIQQLCSNY